MKNANGRIMDARASRSWCPDHTQRTRVAVTSCDACSQRARCLPENHGNWVLPRGEKMRSVHLRIYLYKQYAVSRI